MVAKLDIGGEEWYQCMDVARYGGKWYNLLFSGNIGALMGLSVYTGGLVPAAAFRAALQRQSGVPPVRGAPFLRAVCSADGAFVAWGYRNEAGIFNAGRRALPRRGEAWREKL